MRLVLPLQRERKLLLLTVGVIIKRKAHVMMHPPTIIFADLERIPTLKTTLTNLCNQKKECPLISKLYPFKKLKTTILPQIGNSTR